MRLATAEPLQGVVSMPGQTQPRPCSSHRRSPDATGLLRELRGPVVVGLLVLVLVFAVGPEAGPRWRRSPAPRSRPAPYQPRRQPAARCSISRAGSFVKFRCATATGIIKGQALVVLEGVARADVGRLAERLRTLAAQEARLRAERADVAQIRFHHAILADAEAPAVPAVRAAQLNFFQTRRAAAANREAIQGERIDQLERQIAGLQRQLVSNRRQREPIEEETTDVDELYRRELHCKSRLLALQREDAALLGAAGELEAQIAQAGEAIGETRLEIMDIRIQRIEDVDEQLAEAQMQRGEAEEELAVADDTLRRTEIVAPIAGAVLDLRFKSMGGVIGPGEPVLDLVPLADQLIIEARVRPANIDDVAVGQSAESCFPRCRSGACCGSPARSRASRPMPSQTSMPGMY